jgi:hypothetical protein
MVNPITVEVLMICTATKYAHEPLLRHRRTVLEPFICICQLNCAAIGRGSLHSNSVQLPQPLSWPHSRAASHACENFAGLLSYARGR